MKIKIISIFFLAIVSINCKAQFFVELNSGYDFSVNRFKEAYDTQGLRYWVDNEPFLSRSQYGYHTPDVHVYSVNSTVLYLPVGEGVMNRFSIGYKSSKNLSLKISCGANLNKLNFNYLDKLNQYQNTEYFYRIFSDDELTQYVSSEELWNLRITDYVETIEYKYNIFHLEPELIFHFDIGRFVFGSSVSFSVSKLNLFRIIDGYNEGYTGIHTTKFIKYLKTQYFQLNQNYVVSYKTGINLQYNINDNFAITTDIAYRWLKYEPVKIISNGTFDFYTNDELEDYSFSSEDGISYYSVGHNPTFNSIGPRPIFNMNTIGFSLGLRYYFYSFIESAKK